MDDVDKVLGMLDQGVSPTIAELERAEARCRLTRPTSRAAATARWQIAVALERLSRLDETAPAV